MKTFIYSISFVFFTFFLPSASKAQPSIDFETGAVFTGYNNVRIPGDQGTLFSLKEDLDPQTAFFYRIRLNYTIQSRHSVSVLYAPLETRSEGSMPSDILFEGVVFPANSELAGTYKFNSYRLTYRYDIVKKPKLDFGLGFTAKIRDAKIALSSPIEKSEKTNVGFVPIINFKLWWKIDEKLGLLLYGDALGVPQGRAEDVLIAATYEFSQNIRARAGYRILEGGADNDEVYNFALLHYASFGFSFSF
jgi:hypothetical protein